jgi:hypothetical protein
MTQARRFSDHSRGHRFGTRPALRAREEDLSARLAHCESRIGAVEREGAQMLSLGRERNGVHARLAQVRGELDGAVARRPGPPSADR